MNADVDAFICVHLCSSAVKSFVFWLWLCRAAPYRRIPFCHAHELASRPLKQNALPIENLRYAKSATAMPCFRLHSMTSEVRIIADEERELRYSPKMVTSSNEQSCLQQQITTIEQQVRNGCSKSRLLSVIARKRSDIGRRIRKIPGGRENRELEPLRRRIRFATGAFAVCMLAAVLVGFGSEKAPKDPRKYPWQRSNARVALHILGPDRKDAMKPQAWLLIPTPDSDAGTKVEPLTVADGWVHIDLGKYPGYDVLRVQAKDANGNIGQNDARVGSEELVLVPTGIVRGRFLRPDGKPEAGVVVSAMICIVKSAGFIQLMDSPLMSKVVTDPKGAFSLPGIPRNSTVPLRVADPSVQLATRKIETDLRVTNTFQLAGGTFKAEHSYTYGFQVADAPETALGDINLLAAGQVSGRVVLDGKGVPGIRVAAQVVGADMTDDNVQASGSETITDARGDYVLGGLGNARYNIAVSLPKSLSEQYACAAMDSLAVEVGKTISGQDLRLQPGGVIEGDVFLRDEADPEGYPVAYYGPDHPRSGAWCGRTLCDAKGHFRMRVSPGKHYVYLQASQSHISQDVTVDAGQVAHVTLRE